MDSLQAKTPLEWAQENELLYQRAMHDFAKLRERAFLFDAGVYAYGAEVNYLDAWRMMMSPEHAGSLTCDSMRRIMDAVTMRERAEHWGRVRGRLRSELFPFAGL
jgi:hypothetical protein